ncbi:secretin N-terminal domain-containing protein [Planctomicrobium sp. SH527]|uniref:secretin N-terminal domain-containing protein n=1 Tax=Planctomicrobium sp. SH527 TaxID=3448123 RepID=UPI003F5B5937
MQCVVRIFVLLALLNFGQWLLASYQPAVPTRIADESISVFTALNVMDEVGRDKTQTSSSMRVNVLLAQATPTATPTVQATPGMSVDPVARPASGSPSPPGNKPPGSPLSGATPGKDGAPAKEGEKKDKPAEPAVISRPLTPEKPGDPEQLNIVPDEHGRVRFNFAGQRWKDVLEWLARVSNLSLDWQELPADYLNLRTQRDYSLLEAQDLINRHLLSRGFTMLKSGEVLTVTSIAKLNPAMVPRVAPEELEQRMDYEFVKVSFPLKWILADRVVEELKPMLSSNGKLSALKEVNRFEAMDAAINLKEIHRMLQQEQSQDASKGTVVREFKLKHRRANDVLLSLEMILGIEKNRMPTPGGGRGGDMMSQQIMQQIQQMQQMMQQQRGNQQGSGPAKQEDPRLIVNERENSILAHAPPDKMEIIDQTITAIDVPGDGEAQMLQNISKVKPYRLTTLDPQPLMLILKEMGELSPQSRVQVDDKSKAIILYGTLSDHYIVQSLIAKLDGSNRSFEVIQLRRVQADAVAGTIQYMLGSEEKDKNKNNRSMYGYFYGGGMQQESTAEQRPFKVDADIENNRLLVWANDVEMDEIRQLLLKMGEIPPGTSNPETLRTIQLNSDQEAEKVLERLRELWPEVELNRLQIQQPPQTPERSPAPVESAPAQKPSVRRMEVPKVGIPVAMSSRKGSLTSSTTRPHPLADDDTTGLSPAGLPASLSLADLDLIDSKATPEPRSTPSASEPTTESAEKPTSETRPEVSPDTPSVAASGAPPIMIRRAQNGRIMIGSPDTAALDRLEDLLAELSPPSRDYKIFHLKYPSTWAYGVELNLKTFFKDTSNEETVTDMFWGNSYTTKKATDQRLSRRKELKIISDDDSRTILVQGGTPQQLATIADLIEIYDQPTSGDPQSVRKTEIFRMQYSKADQIADTLKQVYRDLLSANDPSLQASNQNQQQKSTTERIYSYRSGNSENSDDKTKDQQQPLKFKGLLSIGVDEISNSVVVSAGEELLAEIRQTVKALDDAAHPHINVQVLQVQNLDTSLLKERMDKTFAPSVRSSKTGDRNKQPKQSPPPQQPPQADLDTE